MKNQMVGRMEGGAMSERGARSFSCHNGIAAASRAHISAHGDTAVCNKVANLRHVSKNPLTCVPNGTFCDAAATTLGGGEHMHTTGARQKQRNAYNIDQHKVPQTVQGDTNMSRHRGSMAATAA